MPIYEYVCNTCSHEFEEWQKITDSPTKKCPACGKRKVERLVSLSAFHLKGGGWYVTDYGGKKPGRGENGPKSSKDATETSDKTDKTDKADKTTADSSKPKATKSDS